MPENSKTAAFFDLDLTLLSVNSGVLWVKRDWRNGRLNAWQLVQAIFYIFGYKLGVIDMERAMTKALETIKGLDEDKIRGWTAEWYEEEIKPHVAPGGWSMVEWHRKRGHLLVLLTSSSPYESELARQQLGLDHSISTRYEVRDGRFTGEVVPPICFGEGKVTLAESFAEERGVDLGASFFYSDSITDLPMLERVGYPRVVGPDLRLRREASRRGWPVLDWSR